MQNGYQIKHDINTRFNLLKRTRNAIISASALLLMGGCERVHLKKISPKTNPSQTQKNPKKTSINI